MNRWVDPPEHLTTLQQVGKDRRLTHFWYVKHCSPRVFPSTNQTKLLSYFPTHLSQSTIICLTRKTRVCIYIYIYILYVYVHVYVFITSHLIIYITTWAKTNKEKKKLLPPLLSSFREAFNWAWIDSLNI